MPWFLYVHSMTSARRRNRITTNFSERIPVAKRRMTLHSNFSPPHLFVVYTQCFSLFLIQGNENNIINRILTFSDITQAATNRSPAFKEHGTKSCLHVQMHIVTQHNFHPTRCMPCACSRPVNYLVHINTRSEGTLG